MNDDDNPCDGCDGRGDLSIHGVEGVCGMCEGTGSMLNDDDNPCGCTEETCTCPDCDWAEDYDGPGPCSCTELDGEGFCLECGEEWQVLWTEDIVLGVREAVRGE